MTKEEYLAALKKLGLTHASRETALYLGISIRQSQRFADGENQIPRTLDLLLHMYLRRGLPKLPAAD